MSSRIRLKILGNTLIEILLIRFPRKYIACPVWDVDKGCLPVRNDETRWGQLRFCLADDSRKLPVFYMNIPRFTFIDSIYPARQYS